MPKRIEPMEKREIVKRLKMSQSIRGIYRETGTSRDTIRLIKKIALEKGWLDRKHIPSEKEIDKCFNHQGDKSHPLDAFQDKILEWVKLGYTYLVINNMLSKKNLKYSEITVRRYIQKRFPKERRPVIRRFFEPGEVAEVDFGYFGIMYDEKSNRNRKIWVFSMRLNYSRKVYRETVFDQTANTFFQCHIHAFEYFNGVPKKVVCDNLKAAVIKACIHDPMVNRTYRMLAEYYGFLISPCIAGTPQHKGGVEKDMDYVKRNFLPIFRESQKEIGRNTPSAADCVRELRLWTQETDDNHIVKYVGSSPKELFAEETNFMQPVKFERWDPVVWYKRKVGDDWVIVIDKAFYSVPYRLIGKEVTAYSNSSEVVIFFDYDEITRHKKAEYEWERMKKPEHSPPNEAEYLATTSVGVRKWAFMIGNQTGSYVARILDQKGVDGLRPARAVCSLSKTCGNERLEAASKRGLFYNLIGLKHIKAILEKGLDRLPADQNEKDLFEAQIPSDKESFIYARDASYFTMK